MNPRWKNLGEYRYRNTDLLSQYRKQLLDKSTHPVTTSSESTNPSPPANSQGKKIVSNNKNQVIMAPPENPDTKKP